MYEPILNSLYARFSVKGRAQQIRFLQGLIPPMKALHGGYQTSNVVSAAYGSEEAQACYMLRYFLPYSELLPSVLKPGIATGLADSVQQLMFFGPGPAPELYGFFRWLAPRRTRIAARPRLNVHLLDIASNDWSFARDICTEELIPTVWSTPVSYHPRTFDYTTKWAESRLTGIFARTQLFVFQNCLNEVSASAHEHVKANLKWLEEVMPLGSLLVIIDRDKYPSVIELLKWVKGRVAYGYLECLVGREEVFRHNAVPLINTIPAIITTDAGLLIDSAGGYINRPGGSGLFLQREIGYHAVVMRKVRT